MRGFVPRRHRQLLHVIEQFRYPALIKTSTQARNYGVGSAKPTGNSSHRSVTDTYDIKVLYEDNHLLVISKPAGLSCDGGSILNRQKSTPPRPCALEMAREYVKRTGQKPGDAYLALVHRLDRWTSGVMIMAKTSKAAARLNRQFFDRQVRKTYLCVVSGKVEEAGDCHHWLSNTREQRHSIKSPHSAVRRILESRADVIDIPSILGSSAEIVSDDNLKSSAATAMYEAGDASKGMPAGYYEAHLTYWPLGTWSTLPTHTEADGSLSLLEISPTTGQNMLLIDK